MKNQGEPHPLLLSILSATNGATLSNIKNNTFKNNTQDIANHGHPALDPIFINSSHLQLSDTEWSKMSFNPAYGLETISPKSADTNNNSNQHWPLLDDTDYLDSLQESSIANVDLAKLGTITQKGLDTITPVPVTSAGQTGQLSMQDPISKPPIVVHQPNMDHAKTLQPPELGQEQQMTQQSVASLLHPRILKAAELRKAQKMYCTMSQKKVKTPVSKQVSPNKTGAKKPTKAALNAIKPGFINQDLRKIFGLMKKLDTENPILSTPPELALVASQQRQQWLQSLNIAIANFNRREAGMIFSLYHRYPFPEYHQNLMVSAVTEDTTNSSCESNKFLSASFNSQ